MLSQYTSRTQLISHCSQRYTEVSLFRKNGVSPGASHATTDKKTPNAQKSAGAPVSAASSVLSTAEAASPPVKSDSVATESVFSTVEAEDATQ